MTEVIGNHGRGTCRRVVVVWKINVEEGLKELHCIAQNPKVAQGIRESFYEEAHKYGFDPKDYVTWEDRPVVWSRSVFKDRYRLYDLDNKKMIWNHTNKHNDTGDFTTHGRARQRARLEAKKGNLKNYVIQKWNRQRQRWDNVGMENQTSRQKAVNAPRD
jgi:hypothetical protein